MGDWHWRNSMKPTRFFMLDARAALAFCLLLLHFRPWTLALTAFVCLAFFIAERYGLSFDAALRALRCFIVGPRRPNLIWTSKRRMVDYG